jgi:hypothetical protein
MGRRRCTAEISNSDGIVFFCIREFFVGALGNTNKSSALPPAANIETPALP